MKIAYLANTKLPSRRASSVHVMKMCQAFGRNGHDVTLFNPGYEDVEQIKGDIFDYYGVERIFRFVELPRPKVRKLFGLGPFVRSARRIVERSKPDLIYTRCHALAPFWPHTYRTPLILEAHMPMKSHWGFQKLLASRHFRHLVVISNALRDMYTSHYSLEPDQVVVAHDGADTEVKDRHFTHGNTVKIGYTGNLYKGRGIELILELAQRCSLCEFHLAGGTTDDLEYWTRYVKEHNLANVVFHGFLAPGRVSEFRRTCDILIAPYEREVYTVGGKRSTAEWMSPLKIFEYMSSGRPIVTSDLPALREVLDDGVTALLCCPEDVLAWEEAIERLRDDTALCRRIGEQARNVLEQRYTWSGRAKKVLGDVATIEYVGL